VNDKEQYLTSETVDNADKPACSKCVNHFITHDQRFPYGCRAMGFKSDRLPQLQIIAATGTHCLAFQPRAAAPRPRR
jgi:hypothetical protein